MDDNAEEEELEEDPLDAAVEGAHQGILGDVMDEKKEEFARLNDVVAKQVEHTIKQLMGENISASTIQNIKDVLFAMGVPTGDVEAEGGEALLQKALEAVTHGDMSADAAAEEILGSRRDVITAVVAENVALRQKQAFLESLRSASYRSGTVCASARHMIAM